MYPRHVVLLVFVACYEENTPAFAAALALKQNAPHVTLEIVGTARQQHYVTVRNIKVLAWLAFTDLGRADDALPILKSVLQMNDTTNKQSFTKDAMDNLKEAVNKSGNYELVQNFNRIEKFFSENGHIVDKTLDDLLTTEINTSTSQNDYRKDVFWQQVTTTITEVIGIKITDLGSHSTVGDLPDLA